MNGLINREMKKNNIISDWLDQYGDPEIDRFVEKNLEIAERVRNALSLKGWNEGDLAKAMDKSPSEVTKWLSGMHNLTLKNIIKMEQALGIDLIHCEPIKEFFKSLRFWKGRKKGVIHTVYGQIYLLPYIKLTHSRKLNGDLELILGWLKWEIVFAI